MLDRLRAFYRVQARLMWEWRPTRWAILRRTMLSFVGACLALEIAAHVLPGLRIDGLSALLLAALLLLALDGASALLLHWLLVRWPMLVAQILGLGLQFATILALGRFVPGLGVDGLRTAIWATFLLTALTNLFTELVSASDDDSYYGMLVRRLVAHDFERPAEPIPGLLVVQIDGLSLPILHHALRAGQMPVLHRLILEAGATLLPWIPQLPPTTPASQAGILHGRNEGIPGFRWYEKADARTFVANHPEDASVILERISDGTGLLADDGASIGNLFTGDAPRSYLTMASIARKATVEDPRRLRGFFVTTVDYFRLLVLMVGEAIKEIYQAERQRNQEVEPRMRRDLHYAVERALATIALRTVSTSLVIEEMFGGAPTIYVDYTGYDAIAHHSGPERPEAIDALEGIDRAIGSLLKARRHTRRAYRLVVLSDHGQSMGSAFAQRYGEPVEAVIGAHLPETMTIVGTSDPGETAGTGQRLATEIGRGSRVGSRLARRVPRRKRPPGPSPAGEAVPPADVVVCSSGNLAHVYFAGMPGRLDSEAIERLCPGLIEALAQHPGIAVVLVRSATGGAIVLGSKGRLELATGIAQGTDPLAGYRPGAADDLRHLEGFAAAGDLILLGAVREGGDEVTGFEEFVGTHGGLGGWQGEPFILCPPDLQVSEGPLVGAPALYRQLRAWQAGTR